MGYTHYWYRVKVLDAKQFDKASKDCGLICQELGVDIQFEYDNPKLPIFAENEVRFNGAFDEGHETFHISEKFVSPDYRKEDGSRKKLIFAFCKTAYKPYDINVTCCLIVFKHYFGNDFEVFSDGESKDWQPARDKCQEILGYGKDFELDKDDDN